MERSPYPRFSSVVALIQFRRNQFENMEYFTYQLDIYMNSLIQLFLSSNLSFLG